MIDWLRKFGGWVLGSAPIADLSTVHVLIDRSENMLLFTITTEDGIRHEIHASASGARWLAKILIAGADRMETPQQEAVT